MDDLWFMMLRVIVALALGGAIGLERELRERAAGFRTHILVSVGAAAFTLASAYGFEQILAQPGASDYQYDPTRIAAQIVSGIGFLGAGAIIRHGVSVRGLTTAASLWTTAAVGMLSGLGMYALAIAATAIVLLSLAGLRFAEGIIRRRATDESHFYVRFAHRGYGNLGTLVRLLDEHEVNVKQIRSDPEDDEGPVVHLQVSLPDGLTENRLLALVSELDATAGVDGS